MTSEPKRILITGAAGDFVRFPSYGLGKLFQALRQFTADT